MATRTAPDNPQQIAQELKTLAEQILSEAKRNGATSAEVSASHDVGLSAGARAGEVETLEFNQDRSFGVTVYIGTRKGSASTSDTSVQAIRDTVSAALNIAQYTEEDPYAGLAEAELLAKQLPDLDLWHPWAVTPDEAVELAVACEAAGLKGDARITQSDGANVSTHRAVRVYGNSNGFMGAGFGTRHGLSCVLIAEDQNGMQRDYWYTVSRRRTGLESVESVGAEAARRTVARLSPRRAPTGRFPVLFSPQMASGLVGHLVGALSGGALYRRASFLLDSLNTQVIDPRISLFERPHLPGALGSGAFDGDGVATKDQHFIRSGVVESYVLSVYSARRLGLYTTGNASGVHNLCMDGPVQEAAQLLRTMGRGLLVTELMGQGVNGVTGDYSRGASGFWVEGGEIQYPVDELTIASNVKTMFNQVIAIGDDVDERNNLRMPSILIDGMTLAGG